MSAEQYLGDTELCELLAQVKSKEAWRVQATFLEIAKARDLLEMERVQKLLSENT